jgi:hypothetical protein
LRLLSIVCWPIHTQAPARIDLAGGWSDTPPISYEMGGEVVNVAVLLEEDEGCPIGARASILPGEPLVRLKGIHADGTSTVSDAAQRCIDA